MQEQVSSVGLLCNDSSDTLVLHPTHIFGLSHVAGSSSLMMNIFHFLKIWYGRSLIMMKLSVIPI